MIYFFIYDVYVFCDLYVLIYVFCLPRFALFCINFITICIIQALFEEPMDFWGLHSYVQKVMDSSAGKPEKLTFVCGKGEVTGSLDTGVLGMSQKQKKHLNFWHLNFF